MYFIKLRREITTAFEDWADVAPLKFTQVCYKCESDFDIKFVYYEHGDGDPFMINCILFIIF